MTRSVRPGIEPSRSAGPGMPGHQERETLAAGRNLRPRSQISLICAVMSPPGVARTAERLIDALGHETVDVFGVSLGGVVAQQLAHQAPRRVRRLVLAATGPGLGGVPGSPRVLWASNSAPLLPARLLPPRRR
jgi:pimeloyl-ACP methyl ester carboxylesterase